MEPLDGLKKIRDELVKSLELNSASDTMAVPRLSPSPQLLRDVEASIRRAEKD